MKSTAGSSKAMFWGGTAMFAAGMTPARLFEFINKNGGYLEFGEAGATNKAGAAGLSLAFAAAP